MSDKQMSPELISGTVARIRKLADQIERGEQLPHEWSFKKETKEGEQTGRNVFELIYSKVRSEK